MAVRVRSSIGFFGDGVSTETNWVVASTLSVLVMCVIVSGCDSEIQDSGFSETYQEYCASCHGEELQGTGIGPPLVDVILKHGDTVEELRLSIEKGFPGGGMPAWSGSLDDGMLHGLAIYIADVREGRGDYFDFQVVDEELSVPSNIFTSDEHDFYLEVVSDQIHKHPFSIAPMHDGRILVTEKTRGLKIIRKDGSVSDVLQGTEPNISEFLESLSGLDDEDQPYVTTNGSLMDVALHPDFTNNGWIYLHLSDNCDSCALAGESGTMNKLVRGQLKDERWVEEEVVWQASPEDYYTDLTADQGAGGRIAFDEEGFVYISLGIRHYYERVQDLSYPDGKIHRIHDDGQIPTDNPFIDVEGAEKTIWTYGHRSPQGLEYRKETNQLWSTEMGPRGGDELNLLLPGKNFGWPLYSKGLNYNMTPVSFGKQLGIEFALDEIQQPVYDFTPSPAIASFIFYEGDSFSRWQGDIIVGSLAGSNLYRLVLDGDQVVKKETLISRLARFRDIEMGPDGTIFVLLEHTKGSQVVRLVPSPDAN